MQLFKKARSKVIDLRRPEFGLALLVYLMGFILEVWAVQLLSDGLLLKSLMAHLIAALSMACTLCYIMLRHLRPNIAILLFFFLLLIFIPVVSGICLLSSFALGLHYSRSNNIKGVELVKPQYLSRNTINITQQPVFSNGVLYGLLRFSKKEDKRIKAVLSTRYMTNRAAIPILRIALLDSADEVRLLAYSILDNKEKDIDFFIHKGLTKLKSTVLNPGKISSIHQSLAEAYWELSNLGLAKGGARIHILNSARRHVTEALKLRTNDVWLRLLHASIMIALGLFEEAGTALDEAKKHGMQVVNMAEQRAELAFEQKRFDQVANHIQQLVEVPPTDMILDGIVKQWI